MPHRSRSAVARAATIVATLACSLTLLPAGPAQATYPGPNGAIAYTRGNIVLLDGSEPNDGIGSHTQLSLVAPDGTPQGMLTDDDAANFRVQWSPDGTHVAFAGQRATPGGWADHFIAIVDVATGARSEIPCVYGCGGPSWTADGKRLLVGFGPGRDPGIFSVALDGSDVRLVVPVQQGLIPGDAVMSSDGEHIAYTLASDVIVQPASVWVASADGSNAHRLGAGYSADFSPDGQRVAYAAYDPGGGAAGIPELNTTHIAVSDLDGTATTLAASDPGLVEYQPTWSPDGSEIAFGATPLTRFGQLWHAVSTLVAVAAPEDGGGQLPGETSTGCLHGYRIVIQGDAGQFSWGPADPLGGAAAHPAQRPCPVTAAPTSAASAAPLSPRLHASLSSRHGELRVRVTLAANTQGRLTVAAHEHGHSLQRRARVSGARTRVYRYAVRRAGRATVRVRFSGRSGWASTVLKPRRISVSR